MHNFGFSSGARPRIAIAAVWAVLAVGTVLFLDRQGIDRAGIGEGVRQVGVRPVIQEGQVELQLSASYRVGQWRVMVGSQEIGPESADAGSWKATIDFPASGNRFEILVEAQAEDYFAEHRHALLIMLHDGRRRTERTTWGDGDINTLIDVEEWLEE